MKKWIILVGLWILVACQNVETTPLPTTIPMPTATTMSTATHIPSKLVAGTDGYPWWNDTVFYEIFVRSFYDSDGDGVGDINGIIEKLDYLNDGDPHTTDDLGITGIWLMPITRSPSYHGYDVTDYYTIDEEYGTREDFERLLQEAHARGIRVIVDLVLNHTAKTHPWFEASRDPESDKRDWYIWAEENPNYRGPAAQVVWHRDRSGYYYGVFWSGMPDLNYDNPAVTAQMQDVTRFWLEDMKVDGFRLDAIKHLIERQQLQENTRATHEWFQNYHTFYKEINPDALTVGETWTATQQVLKYTGNEVDIAFQFDLAEAALNSVKSGFGVQVGKEQQTIVDTFPAGQYATFLTNHDQNRVMSFLDGNEEQAKLSSFWLLTSPGVPFIYYGEEIGMFGEKPDEDIRRPMQWEGSSYRAGFTEGRPWRVPFSDYETRNVTLQNADSDSLLNHYRTLIQLRNEHEALRIGEWISVETESRRVYAYLRQSDEETLLVVMNFDDKAVSDYMLSLESGNLPASLTATSLFGESMDTAPISNNNGGFTEYKPLAEMPAYNMLIIQLNPQNNG